MSSRSILLAALLGAASFHAAIAQAASPTLLDEITIATLTAQEKSMLENDLFNDLNKDDDDQQAHVWHNGADPARRVTVTYNFSNSAMTEHSLQAHVCRDLKFKVAAAGKTQDLSRRTCSQSSGRWDIQGKDAPAATYPAFLSDVTVASLNAAEKKSLLEAAVRAVKDDEEGATRNWSNQGLGNAAALKVRLTVSGTDAKPGTYRTCRDLAMALDGQRGQQTLTRRICEDRYHNLDIEADYVADK